MSIHLSAPAIIILVLMAIGTLIDAHNHGKSRTGNHNFLVDLIGHLMLFGLLWWGGFFK